MKVLIVYTELEDGKFVTKSVTKDITATRTFGNVIGDIYDEYGENITIRLRNKPNHEAD